MKKNVIWTNNPYMMEDEERREMLETWADIMDPEGSPEGWDIWDICDWWYGYERLDELKMETGNIPGTIVVMADIGTWHGPVHGYKMLGSDAGDCFDPGMFDLGGCDYLAWYTEGDELKSEHRHHDGVNTMAFYYAPDKKMEALGLDDYDLDAILYDGMDMDGEERNIWDILEPLTTADVFR